MSSRDDVPTLPGIADLLCGYNVFAGLYASSRSTTYPLINWGGLEDRKAPNGEVYATPTILPPFVDLVNFEYLKIFGATASEFQTRLAVNLDLEGSYKFFSGELSVEFNQSQLASSIYEFSTIKDRLNLWGLKTPPSGVLIEHLKESVLFDLINLEPYQLFFKYGTHYLSSLVLGGRVSYSNAVNKASFHSKYYVEVVAEFSYQDLIGQLSSSDKVKYQSSIESFQSSSVSKLNSVGGDSVYDPRTDYDDWRASVKGRPVFIDFLNSQSLQPIWDLIADDSRRHEVKAAYPTFAKNASQSPADNFIVAVAIDKSYSHVYAYRASGLYSVGTSGDLSHYQAGKSFLLPDGCQPTDLVAVAMSETAVIAWFSNGTYVSGSFDSFTGEPRQFTVLEGETPESIVGIAADDHDPVNWVVYYRSGRYVHAVSPDKLTGRVGTYRVVGGATCEDILGCAIAPDETMYTWLRSGSAGQTGNYELLLQERVWHFVA